MLMWNIFWRVKPYEVWRYRCKKLRLSCFFFFGNCVFYFIQLATSFLLIDRLTSLNYLMVTYALPVPPNAQQNFFRLLLQITLAPLDILINCPLPVLPNTKKNFFWFLLQLALVPFVNSYKLSNFHFWQ